MRTVALCESCKNGNICKYRDEFIKKFIEVDDRESIYKTTISPIYLELKCSSYEQNGKYRHPLDDWDPSGSVKEKKVEIKRGSIK